MSETKLNLKNEIPSFEGTPRKSGDSTVVTIPPFIVKNYLEKGIKYIFTIKNKGE